MCRAVGERRLDDGLGDVAGSFGGHLAAGPERTELDLESERLSSLDGQHHVWPRFAFDERFDGELEQQHAVAL